MAKSATIHSTPQGAVYISVSENEIGYVNSLFIRIHNEDGSYDRYCATSDQDNKASQLQMFRSLVQMCKEIAGANAESPMPSTDQPNNKEHSV